MYIQTKKVIILFIFLITIIIGLVYKGQEKDINVINNLLISSDSDLKENNFSKKTLDSLNSLNINKENGKKKEINNSFITVKETTSFTSVISNQGKDKDNIIIIGQKYDKYISKVVEQYPTTKFILIESKFNAVEENVVTININWERLFKTIISNLKLSDGTTLVYILNNNEYEKEVMQKFQSQVSLDGRYQMKVLYSDSTNISEELDKEYKDYKNTQYFCFNYKIQNQIIKELVSLQTENVYEVQKEQNKNSDDKTELNYLKIEYTGLYIPNLYGEYDYTLDGNIEKRNIIKELYDIDLITTLEKIMTGDSKKETINLEKINTNTEEI